MEDERIVQLYFRRDEQAIPETAKKYGNYCASIAKNILGNQEDAEECVNDTYLRAWNSMPPQGPQILSAFLGRIVRNIAFERYRYNTAEKRGGGEILQVLDELEDCVSGCDSVEQAFETGELVGAINDFLAGLPGEKRNAFVCRYWYADSVADIAARYGMSGPAVSMMLGRLRTKLRDYLSERGYEL